MGAGVSWMLEFEAEPVLEWDFRAPVAEMVHTVQAGEVGALGSEWSTCADGTRCHLCERGESAGPGPGLQSRAGYFCRGMSARSR